MLREIIVSIVDDMTLPNVNPLIESSTDILANGNIDEIMEQFEEVAEIFDINVKYVTLKEGMFYLKYNKTDKQIKEEMEKRVERKLWYTIYKKATENGFKRVGFCSSKLKEFDNMKKYDMVKEKNYDMLFKYYSLYFKNGDDK